MKAKLNNPKIILWLLATSLFLSVSQSAFGQEIIREAEYFESNNSIIRAKGNDTVLIYTKTDVSSSFLMVANGMPLNVPQMDMGDLYINDFEITTNGLYFCGYRVVAGRKKAIFGGFSLISFPNSTVKYYELDTCTELRKLDYYVVQEGPIYYDQEGHLVMTGTTMDTRSDVLVDRVVFDPSPAPVPVPYSSMMYFSNDENESFDDVAVTDNLVVVSTRRKVEGLQIIDFWQFNRPTLLGYDIFSSSCNHILLGNPAPETSVILEHVEKDDYAATYKIEGYPINSRIAMLQVHNPSGLINSVEILEDETLISIPIDIKYNKSTQVFDILAKRRFYRDDTDLNLLMQIYHITQDVINNTVTLGKGTRYPGRRLWSIDPTESTQFFVASGSEDMFLRFFKYMHDKWKLCPEDFDYRFFVGEPQGAFNKDEKVVTGKRHDEILFKLDPHTLEFPVKCAAN